MSLGYLPPFQAWKRSKTEARPVCDVVLWIQGRVRVSQLPLSLSGLHTLSQWPLEACGRSGHLSGVLSASLLWQKPLRSGVWPLSLLGGGSAFLGAPQ